MDKKTKTALIVGGSFAAAIGLFGIGRNIVNNLLVKEALDRNEPKVLAKAMPKISGNAMTKEVIASAAQKGEVLGNLPHEVVSIESFDGTKLVGHYFKAENEKRIIIAMHGWRSVWCRDYGGIYNFWFESGCSVLFAEQRGQGNSEGDYMGFGMVERYDCLEWAKWADANNPESLPIYLAGVSLGATTVLMTAGFDDLPKSVAGIIADCGFTSPKDIWKFVLEKNLKLSFGLRKHNIDRYCKKRINMKSDEYTTIDAMQNCKVPVLFIHGTDDHFVPVKMTYDNYDACVSPKRLLIVDGADHGFSYYVAKELYEETTLAFFAENDGTKE